jgi:hypothetical protein
MKVNFNNKDNPLNITLPKTHLTDIREVKKHK